MAFTFLEDAPVGVTFLDDEPTTGVTFLDEPVEPVAPTPQSPAPSFTATMPVKIGQPIGTPQDFATFDPNTLLAAPARSAPTQSVDTGNYKISYAKAAPTNAVPALNPINGEWTPEVIASQNARADEFNRPTESALRERSYNEALTPFFQESQGPRRLTKAEWWASQTPRVEAFEPKTFTGEIGKGNIPGAIGVAYKAARESLTGILPPTEEQILNESVPWGTNPDGSVKYEYKPLGSRLDKTGIMTPLLETQMMSPEAGDSTMGAVGKSTFNFMAGLVNFGLSPLGIATVGLGGAVKATTRIAGSASAGLGAEGSVAAETAARLAATARVVSGGFAIDMASAVPEQYKAATESPTLQGRIEGWLGTVSSLGFAALAAKHAAKKPLELAERQTIESVVEFAKRTPDAVLETVARNMEVDVYSRNLAIAELQRRQTERQAALAPEAAAAAEAAGTALPSGTARPPAKPNAYDGIDSQAIQDALDGKNGTIPNPTDRAAAITELERRQAKDTAAKTTEPPDPAATAVGVIKTAAAADAAGKPFSPRIEEPGTPTPYGRETDVYDITTGLQRKPAPAAKAGEGDVTLKLAQDLGDIREYGISGSGDGVIAASKNADGTWGVEMVNVTIPKKGTGSKAYIRLNEILNNEGSKLVSGPRGKLTQAALRMWDGLVRDGYAEKVTDVAKSKEYAYQFKEKPAPAAPAAPKVAPPVAPKPESVVSPKPKGPEPTIQQSLNEALEVSGDLPSAWENLDNQVKALENNETNKAAIKRLNAAKRKIENTLEEESRRSEIEQLEVEQNKGYELLSSIKQLGGLPTLGEKGRYATGELKRIAEASKGAFLSFFRKGAKSLDQLRESLNERGFDFETPEQMLMAIEDSLATNKKQYGSQFPEGYTGGPGAMGPVERAYMEASRKIIGGYNADVEASQIRRGQNPSVSEARKEDPVTFEAAMDAIEKNPALPEKLVEDILKKEKKSITDEEQLILTYRRAELDNNMAAESERAIDPSLTPQEQAFHQANAEVLEAQLLRAEEANRMAGTASGRALRSRQMQMNEDYTYAGLMMRERKLTGDVVPRERAQELKKTADEYKKAQAEVDAEVETRKKLDEDAELDAKVDAYERSLETERNPNMPYSKAVLDWAEREVSKLEAKAAPAAERLSKMFGSESGAVNLGVGGPKGEGKKMGSSIKAQDNSIIRDLADVITARIARFGVNRAKNLEVIAAMYPGSQPYFDKAYKLAVKTLDKVTSGKPKKVAEAVKTGATAPEKQPKPPKSKDTLVGEGLAAIEKGDGISNIVAQIVNGIIEAGNRNRPDIFKKAHKIVQEFMPEATERDVRRAYVDYGKKTFPNPDEVAAFKRKTRQAAKIEEDIARIKNEKLRPELQGYQREKLDQELRRLTQERSELLKDSSLPQEPGAFASKDEAKQTRIKNRIAELDGYLKGEKPVEKRPTQPDSAKTEQLRAEKEALEAYVKEVDAAKNPPLSDAQKALDSAMIARERAGQTLDDISTGKVKDPVKIKEALTQLEEDVRLETDALKALAAEMRRDAKPKGDPGYLKEQAQIKALERAIASYAERVAKGDLAGKGKVQGPDSRRVAQLKAIRDSRRAAYQAAKDAGKPVLTPEQRWNATRLKALTKREADFAEKIRTGQYARPPKRVPPKMDVPTQDAQIRVDAIKQKFLKEQFDYYQKQRATSKKIVDGIGQTLRAGINIVSSTDLSGFRQGMGTTMMALGKTVFPVDVRRGASGKTQVVLTNPLKSAMMILRPGAKMIVSGISEQKARRMEKARENRPNAKSGAYEEMGIDITNLDTKVRSKHEEMMSSVLDEWAQLPMRTGSTGKTIITAPGKVAAKVVRASNRAFNTLLNEMRLDLADSLLAENYKDRAPTPAELKVLGNLVNIATGRGNINPTLARGAGYVFWAPSLFASRVKGLTMEPIWSIKQPFSGTGRARAAVAKEYARVIISGYLLWKTAQMFSDDDADTTNPTSSDFGKIVRGNTRIDPWGGHQQVGVLVARAITGKTTSIEGKERNNDLGAVIINFGRNKLRPDWGALWNAYEIYIEKPMPGRPETYAEVVASMYTPMSLRDIVDIMRDRGMTEGAIIEALAMFGAGVSVYGDEQETRSSR